MVKKPFCSFQVLVSKSAPHNQGWLKWHAKCCPLPLVMCQLLLLLGLEKEEGGAEPRGKTKAEVRVVG